MTQFIPSRFLLLAGLLLAGSARPASGADFERMVKPFFQQHCTSCHGEQKQKGDLRVDTLVIHYDSPKIMGHWEEIMNRINSGDMPPAKESRPKPGDIARMADWIAGQLREAETARQSSASERVAFRKLSREEYANTIRDLLGVRFEVKSPTGLPEDPDWKGFERIGSVLSLSPAHVEKHLAAAEAILDEALSVRPEPKRALIHWGAFDLRWKGFQPEYEARGIADKVRIEIVPNNYTTDTWNVDIKTTGEYVLRLKLRDQGCGCGHPLSTGSRAPRLKVYLSSIDKTLIEQDVDAPEDPPVTIEARVHLVAGKYPVRIINSVPGPNPEARRSRHSGTANAFTTTRSRVPWQLELTDDDFKPIQPTLIIDSVVWDGPIVDSWPTAAHQRIFFGGETATKDGAYARQIVARFAEQAWRRPVQPARLTKRRSVLDAVLEDAKSLRLGLGKDDRTKLDEYLHSVRDVEQRTERLDAWLNVPKPVVDKKLAAPFQQDVSKAKAGEYWRTMFDIITLALRTDMTRVVTYMNGSEGNGLAIPEIGITQARHNLSHHNGDPVVLERLAKSDAFIMEQFAHFLDELRAIKDGDEPLLDRTMVLFGSGMSYGHSHANSNLPILLAGGRGLGLKHGQHIDYNQPHLKGDYTLGYDEWRALCGKPKDEKARLSNVMLTMLQKMDVQAERFVDSLGPVSEVV